MVCICRCNNDDNARVLTITMMMILQLVVMYCCVSSASFSFFCFAWIHPSASRPRRLVVNVGYSSNGQQSWFHHISSSSKLYLNEERSSWDSNDSTDHHSSSTTTSDVGLNELHTILRDVVEKQDFIKAGVISDQIAEQLYPGYTNMLKEDKQQLRKTMSWNGLGAAPWLIDRLTSLNYTFPTTIQINAFQAVNAILNRLNNTGTNIEDMSLEQRMNSNANANNNDNDNNDNNNRNNNMGIVVSGTTGSGKTLSYAVPLLSTLSDSLFLRQRLRISDEEAVGDTAGDLVDRISVVTSPRLTSSSRKQTRTKGAIATGASISTLGRSGRDVKNPLALIVVPTRELGVQTAMLLYQLVGGNIKNSPTESSGKANMFKYKGPKGIRIGCVLDDEEASFGLKLQTDIAITTPQYIGKLLDDGDIIPNRLRVIVYDEADLCLEQTNGKDLQTLFGDNNKQQREFSRLTMMVGATVTEALGNLAVSSKILPNGKSYIATATKYAALKSDNEEEESLLSKDAAQQVLQIVGSTGSTHTASLQDLNVCLYPNLKHERVIVKKNESGLLILTRLLRNELQKYDNDVKSGNMQQQQRPRVVVFFPDEQQAKAAIEPLRDALWGEHLLCVLLPKTGVSPLSIMDQFKRNQTSVMLATPNSVRGLDFPALTHVYTLYLPLDDPREYLHLAGRVGRVGHTMEGHVVSVLKEDVAEKMNELAQKLGFIYTDIVPPSSEDIIIRNDDGEIDENLIDIEKLRRSFEDTIALLDTVDDPEIKSDNNNVLDVTSSSVIDDDDEDEDEEEEESFQ